MLALPASMNSKDYDKSLGINSAGAHPNEKFDQNSPGKNESTERYAGHIGEILKRLLSVGVWDVRNIHKLIGAPGIVNKHSFCHENA